MKNKDFCTATNAMLARFGLSDAPPLISGATDTGSEDHRRNCLAFYLLCTRAPRDLQDWLQRQGAAFAADMCERLNLVRHQVDEMRREVADQ